MKVEEPETNYVQVYTYADYLNFTGEELFEIIKGKLFKMSPAPLRVHQGIAGNLFNSFFNYLKGKHCKVYIAPFDVRLAKRNTKNEAITTVVQPDICVICDLEKLDKYGCIGAPDLVVEILSAGNNKKELQNKYEVYEENGVKEYWIIHPDECTLLIYTLINGKYVPSKLFTIGDIISSTVLENLSLNLTEIFENI